jgi:hypothetical protein
MVIERASNEVTKTRRCGSPRSSRICPTTVREGPPSMATASVTSSRSLGTAALRSEVLCPTSSDAGTVLDR